MARQTAVTPDGARLRAHLEAIKASGVSAAGAVELAVIEGLLRRADTQSGEAGAWLLERASQRLQAAGALARTGAPDQAAQAAAPTVGLEALRSLVTRLNAQPAHGAVAARESAASSRNLSARDTAKSRPAAEPRALQALAAHGPTWARLRTDQRLREARAQIPAQAGPLHAAQLVYRALQDMQRLSPGYLEAFMAHVDDLAWLEQSSGMADLSARTTPRTEGGRKTRQAPARRR